MYLFSWKTEASYHLQIATCSNKEVGVDTSPTNNTVIIELVVIPTYTFIPTFKNIVIFIFCTYELLLFLTPDMY